MYIHRSILWAALSLFVLAQAAPVDIDSSALENAKVPYAPSFFPPLRLSDLGRGNSTVEKRWNLDDRNLEGIVDSVRYVDQDQLVKDVMDSLIESFPDWNIMAYQREENNISWNYNHFHRQDRSVTSNSSKWYEYDFVIFKGKGWLRNGGDFGWRNWAMYGLYERDGNLATFQAWPGYE